MRPLQTLGRASFRNLSILATLPTLALLGCGGEGLTGTDDVQQVSGDVGALATMPDAASTIAFERFKDDVGPRATTTTRTLIRSASGYQTFFGHAAPTAVDFSREWVMFYAAGSQPTDGYDTNFVAVLRSGTSLIAITQLDSPGALCTVAQTVTAPYALIKFPAQAGTTARFYKNDSVRDCVADPCAAVKCPLDSKCDPANGKCVSGSPVSVCGGIAGIGCPGQGQCVDDPSDSCDPKAGGADCGGICSCVQTQACAKSTQFDSSPGVCACVPIKPPLCGPVCAIYCQYGNVLDANGCPTCGCNPPPADPCATVKCASGTHCDSGKCLPDKVGCSAELCDITCPNGTAVDANGCPICSCNPPPVDLCATVKCASGTHCDSGKCVSDGIACGGITGKACPGSGQCVDNPQDTCDPAKGGADCSGICQCVQKVLCTTNSRFDSAPSVCACVPVTTDVCPKEKCPLPAPASASMICPDGSTAGPTCAPTATGTCAWTVTTCPKS